MSTALLIIDVQNTLCRGKWAAFNVEATVSRINEVADRIRATGGSIFFIQHEEDHDAMRFGSDGWQLFDGLKVQQEDPRVRKTACDAFFKTELRSRLQERLIDHVVICGMQTEYCVDSTVRGALANGLSVTVVKDGHTTLDNGVLTANQIIAHHNVTMASLGNFGPKIKVTPASDLRFDAQTPN